MIGRKKSNKSISLTYLLVLILVGIRIFGQILGLVYGITTALVFLVLYLVALYGVYCKRKWGFILVMIISLVDLGWALYMGGSFGIGAGIVDIILLVSALVEYQKL